MRLGKATKVGAWLDFKRQRSSAVHAFLPSNRWAILKATFHCIALPYGNADNEQWLLGKYAQAYQALGANTLSYFGFSDAP